MNTFTSRTRIGRVAVALCFCVVGAAAQPRTTIDRDQLERKLQSTSTLIESSSAAKQIERSGVATAAAERAKARDLHRQAADALKAGQFEQSSKLLDDASRTLFQGVKMAAPEQLVASKEKTDFDTRMQSTRALLDAQKRIAAEKKSAAAGDVSRRVEAQVAEATELARTGKLVEARRVIDQAYLTVKVSIGTMREGDSLVRSLNFATKAEEYAYEIDRNDTHRMLVDMLLKEKRAAAASLDKMVDDAMAEATRLRREAEAQAARKDHETAIKTVEQSTRELVKAIRGAGVYIPG